MHTIELVYYNTGIQVKFFKERVEKNDFEELIVDDVEYDPFFDDEFIESKQITFDDILNGIYDDDFLKSESLRVSFTRTKNMIYYLARSGCWDWFLTLTLSPDRVDRYNLNECSKKLRKHLNNIKNRVAPDMYYLIVPEQHKDGAWHFHGLVGNCPELHMIDSGKREKDGSIIYNWSDYLLGFTTATKVKDTARVSNYICKYITKDICKTVSGRQRYFVSKNAPRAQKYTVDLDWRLHRPYFEWLCENSSYIKKCKNDYCNMYIFETAYFPEELPFDEYPEPQTTEKFEKLLEDFRLSDLGFKKCTLDWSAL